MWTRITFIWHLFAASWLNASNQLNSLELKLSRLQNNCALSLCVPRNRVGVGWILLVANASFHSQILRSLTLMEQVEIHWVWFWCMQINDCSGNDINQYQELVLGIFCQVVTPAHCWEPLTGWQTRAAQADTAWALDRFVFSEDSGREILPLPHAQSVA